MTLMILLIVAILLAGWVAFCGYRWSWGPFASLHNLVTAKYPGNQPQYALSSVEKVSDSPLENKRIVFLGSSVTYGSSSLGVSFADYICARNGAIMAKEALSGTTMADNGPMSYLSRLKRMDKNMDVDLFVCQVSTNDAWTKAPVGDFTGPEVSAYDTSTVIGGTEAILAYVWDTWGCPVVFYTSPRFESEKYDEIVAKLNVAAPLWRYAVIDMWNDKTFNQISERQRALYMADHAHPTQAGYRDWWTPYMEPVLIDKIQRK